MYFTVCIVTYDHHQFHRNTAYCTWCIVYVKPYTIILYEGEIIFIASADFCRKAICSPEGEKGTLRPTAPSPASPSMQRGVGGDEARWSLPGIAVLLAQVYLFDRLEKKVYLFELSITKLLDLCGV